jgi:hypothetical protein
MASPLDMELWKLARTVSCFAFKVELKSCSLDLHRLWSTKLGNSIFSKPWKKMWEYGCFSILKVLSKGWDYAKYIEGR